MIAEGLQDLAGFAATATSGATALTGAAAPQAVSAALQAAAIQDGLAQLMADLVQAEQTPGLPPPVQAAIVQLLDFRAAIGAEPTAADVKEALMNSGLFPDAAGAQANPPRTDMKTALLVLQQALKTWLSAVPTADPASAPAAAGKPSQSPAANPFPSSRGGPWLQPGDATPPSATRFAAAGFFPADPQAIAKAPQAGTQIPASSQSPAAAVTATTLPAEAPLASAATEAPIQLPPSVSSVSAAPQSTPPRTMPSQGTAQPNAAQEPMAASSPPLSPANAASAAKPGGVGPETENVFAPRTPPLPTPEPASAARAPVPGFASSQPGTAPTPAPNAAIAAGGEAAGGAAANAPAPSPAPPVDMKSALLVLQQVLKTSLAIAAPQSYPLADAKSAAGEAGRPPADSPPPPYRGAPVSAQRSLPTSLPGGADAHLVGEVLIRRTDAALAHMKLLQLASLPDAHESPLAHQPAGSRWMFEIPFATPQGTAIAQFQISRDADGGAGGERTGPVWRARFSLDIEPIGPVHAQVALRGERAWVTLWAERETGVQALRDKQSALSKSLKDCDFAAEIAFCLGTPHRRVAAAGQFLDSAS
jgi:hypothetical protein